MQTEQTTAPPPAPENPSVAPASKSPSRGRPRALDDAKRSQICGLVAGGCGLSEAARYVRCGLNTIRRDARRNLEFGQQLRDAEMYAQLSPLRAMQHAIGTHWRAAAWMLERAFPERFGRPELNSFGPRQARDLMDEVLRVVSSEIHDPFKSERVAKRVRGAFEYHVRVACDRRRSPSKLREAMRFFDDKDKVAGPLAEFGITIPDVPDYLLPQREGQPATNPPKRGEKAHTPLDATPAGNRQPAEPSESNLKARFDRFLASRTNGQTQ